MPQSLAMSIIRLEKSLYLVPRTILQVIATLGLVLFLFSAADRASGATFTVTKIADTADGVCDADCSLREAIMAANAVSSDDFVAFDPVFFGLQRTIVVTGNHVAIENKGALIISGPGANLLTISGNDQNRIFLVNENALASFYNVTLAHGKATSLASVVAGGAVFVRSGATAAFDNATIENNTGGPAVFSDFSGFDL